MWKFVAPGSTRRRRRRFLPFLLITRLLRGGAAFAYSSRCLGSAFPAELPGQSRRRQQEALPGVGNYLSFCTRFLFGFGVAFLLPILLMILERAGSSPRAAGQVAALRDRRLGGGVGGADAARRGFDATAAGAALQLYEFAILAIRSPTGARPPGPRCRAI
jgi:sec-independent protein translocase protein TatC